MNGFDLVEEHKKDILMHALKMPCDHMEVINQECVLVCFSN